MSNSVIKEKLFQIRCQLAKPSWWRQFKIAMENEKKSPDELAEFNFNLRRETLRFAYEKSPYYHNLYKKAGLLPDDIKSETDWDNVPILTREALRVHFEQIKISDVPSGRYTIYMTGGSTGEPSKVMKDNYFSSKGMGWRARYWSGVKCGQNMATIMRFHPHSFRKHMRHLLAWYPSQNILLDAGNMNEDTIKHFIHEWRKTKPVSALAYVGGVHELALYCLRNQIDLPPPLAITTVAAPLGAVQRNDIEKAFNAPVYDSYVATEVSPIATQCSELVRETSRALHIHSDFRHVEFLDDDGHAVPIEEEGQIAVTDCGDRVFPIIRYTLGDRGRALAKKCSCGRPFPLMDAVKGRSSDFIYLRHGKLAGECWSVAFNHCFNAVHNFRIHQYADYRVTLFVVPNRNCAGWEQSIKGVVADLQKKMGDIPLTLKMVEELKHDRGKIKYIISDIRK